MMAQNRSQEESRILQAPKKGHCSGKNSLTFSFTDRQVQRPNALCKELKSLDGEESDSPRLSPLLKMEEKMKVMPKRKANHQIRSLEFLDTVAIRVSRLQPSPTTTKTLIRNQLK